MRQKSRRLQREQLDTKFSELRKQAIATPPRGWIRAIRESLGMSVAQLASRLGIPRQNVDRIERSEKTGHITVGTLKRVADTLSCDLQITLIPRIPLESVLEKQAYEVAKNIIQRTNLHMSLENQQTDSQFTEKRIKDLAEELIRSESRQIWEKK